MSSVFLCLGEAEKRREFLLANNIDHALKEKAEQYMLLPELSVTYHKSRAVSGNPHDFYSEAPYWWPDESNPDGPFIRRDGEYYPERFTAHRDDLTTLSDAVCLLAEAGTYLHNTAYFQKAVSLIEVWFLNLQTKMTPHLEYAQAIKGVCDGRGIGIIDTVCMIKLVYGAHLIEQSGLFCEQINGLKEWLAAYVTWLNESPKGLDEKNYFNNHSAWWTAQVAAYCAFVGNDELLSECFEKYKSDLIVNQVDDLGRFVDEITRTRSFTYSDFNLTAFAIICEFAYARGVDLWDYEASNGNSMKKCVEYFKPFYENPKLWEHPQIDKASCYYLSLGMKLAAKRYNDVDLQKINAQKQREYCTELTSSHLGLIQVL